VIDVLGIRESPLMFDIVERMFLRHTISEVLIIRIGAEVP
jgi:hypothetical protein